MPPIFSLLALCSTLALSLALSTDVPVTCGQPLDTTAGLSLFTTALQQSPSQDVRTSDTGQPDFYTVFAKWTGSETKYGPEFSSVFVSSPGTPQLIVRLASSINGYLISQTGLGILIADLVGSCRTVSPTAGRVIAKIPVEAKCELLAYRPVSDVVPMVAHVTLMSCSG